MSKKEKKEKKKWRPHIFFTARRYAASPSAGASNAGGV